MSTKIGKGIIGKIVFEKLFELWQSLGFHVTPNHFYSPIPDTRSLREKTWQNASELVGINMNVQEQLKFLNEICAKFKGEYDLFPMHKTLEPHQYYINNGSFRTVDGEILYCIIRHFKPKKIFEIGSGNSTYLSAQACLKNREETGINTDLVAIDPYPNDIIKKGFSGLSKVISKKVEDIDLNMFNKLEKNDILFIDSSHVVKMGNDVLFLYLEILPRLNEGVLVHIHDIFLPMGYPRDWVLKLHRFWNEQYLLHAFLLYNHSFEVLWASYYMHLKYSKELEKVFKSYRIYKSYDKKNVWHWAGPNSFVIRKNNLSVRELKDNPYYHSHDECSYS